jgi:hypothetical protein
LIFRLAREGDGTTGPMGVKSITNHLNAAGICTRDGGHLGIDAVYKVLTRTTYIGRHRFNTKFWKTRERKPETEVVEMMGFSGIQGPCDRAVRRRASVARFILNQVRRRLLSTGRQEKLRSRALSTRRRFESCRVRHFGTELGTPKPGVFALEAATRVRSNSLFDPIMRSFLASTSTRWAGARR